MVLLLMNPAEVSRIEQSSEGGTETPKKRMGGPIAHTTWGKVVRYPTCSHPVPNRVMAKLMAGAGSRSRVPTIGKVVSHEV